MLVNSLFTVSFSLLALYLRPSVIPFKDTDIRVRQANAIDQGSLAIL